MNADARSTRAARKGAYLLDWSILLCSWQRLTLHLSRRKSYKRRNKSLDLGESHSDPKEDCRSRRHERAKETRKLSHKKEKRDDVPSPMRLSSFLQRSSDGSDRETS